MYFILFIVFCTIHWTHQHLTYPVNYCNMASVCVHDNRQVCASTPDGCSRRSFIDQCDMYEYNCDYGTKYSTKASSPCMGYQETYYLYCITSDLEGYSRYKIMDGTERHTTEQTTFIPPCSPTTIRKPTRTTTKPTCTTTKLTSTTTKTTSTTTKTTSTTKATEITTKPTKTTRKSTNLPTLRIFTICCDRPKTWKTTTSSMKIFTITKTRPTYTVSPATTYRTISPIIFSRTTTKAPTTTEAYRTTLQATTTTIFSTTTKVPTRKVQRTTTVQQPTPVLTTASRAKSESLTFNIPKTTETVKSTIQEEDCNYPECCDSSECDRPLTWETTVETTPLYFVIPKVYSTTPVITTEGTTEAPALTEKTTTTRQTTEGTTITITTTTIKPTTKPTKMTTIPTTMITTITTPITTTTTSTMIAKLTSPTTKPIQTPTSPKPTVETETKTIQTTRQTTEEDFSEQINEVKPKQQLHLDEMKDKLKNTDFLRWYPNLICGASKCERPVTWHTTRRDRRRHRLN